MPEKIDDDGDGINKHRNRIIFQEITSFTLQKLFERHHLKMLNHSVETSSVIEKINFKCICWITSNFRNECSVRLPKLFIKCRAKKNSVCFHLIFHMNRRRENLLFDLFVRIWIVYACLKKFNRKVFFGEQRIKYHLRWKIKTQAEKNNVRTGTKFFN